jgi:hypothetical protein
MMTLIAIHRTTYVFDAPAAIAISPALARFRSTHWVVKRMYIDGQVVEYTISTDRAPPAAARRTTLTAHVSLQFVSIPNVTLI